MFPKLRSTFKSFSAIVNATREGQWLCAEPLHDSVVRSQVPLHVLSKISLIANRSRADVTLKEDRSQLFVDGLVMTAETPR